MCVCVNERKSKSESKKHFGMNIKVLLHVFVFVLCLSLSSHIYTFMHLSSLQPNIHPPTHPPVLTFSHFLCQVVLETLPAFDFSRQQFAFLHGKEHTANQFGCKHWHNWMAVKAHKCQRHSNAIISNRILFKCFYLFERFYQQLFQMTIYNK